MKEMTIPEAIAKTTDYLDGYHVPADRAEALRLAVEALNEKQEREAKEERIKKARDRYWELYLLSERRKLTKKENEEMIECYFAGEME